MKKKILEQDEDDEWTGSKSPSIQLQSSVKSL